jgi:hypothetical protein
MYLAHEMGKVHAAGVVQGHSGVKQIHQPGLAAPHWTPDVDPATCSRIPDLGAQSLQPASECARSGLGRQALFKGAEPPDDSLLVKVNAMRAGEQ